jgi:hypothetical protein
MINLYCHKDQNSNWVSNYEPLHIWSSRLVYRGGWNTEHFIHVIQRQDPDKKLFNIVPYAPDLNNGYYLLFYGSSLFLNGHYGLTFMDPKIIDKVNQGLLKLLIVFVHETFDTNTTIKSWVDSLGSALTFAGITRPNSVIFFTSTDINNALRSQIRDPRLIWTYYPWFELAFKDMLINNQITKPTAIDFSKKDKKFISLISQGRLHRLLLTMFFYHKNLIDQGYVTWHDEHLNSLEKLYNIDPDPFRFRPNVDSLQNLDFLEFYLFAMKFGALPKVELDGDPMKVHSKSWIGCAEYFEKSYVDIINETKGKMYDGTVFLTEKSFKPIFHGLPFIVNGSQNHLEGLRKLGYLTWSELFDESYDALPSSFEKVMTIGQLIEKMCVDPEFLKKMHFPSMLNKLQYNQNLFWNKSHSELIHQILFESLIK